MEQETTGKGSSALVKQEGINFSEQPPRYQIASLSFSAPLGWLQKGLQDFRRYPFIGAFYGLCFAIMGHLVWWVLDFAPAYALALSAGFLMMGPFMCLGLYEVSRRIEYQLSPMFLSSVMAWRSTLTNMAIYSLILLILEMLWSRASILVFAIYFRTFPSSEKVHAMLLSLDHWEFIVAYMLVGGVFASLIFVSSVVSIPMILHRKVDGITAAITSIRACLANPWVMAWWGLIVAGVTFLAMLPFFLGLIVVGPVIGHASWYAYRQVVVESHH